MKIKHQSILNGLAVFILTLGFISCDEDFATLGTGIIGSDNFETNSITYPVITYNQDISPLQGNGLPAYLLGFNSDPLYGDFTASFVGQLTPESYDPIFGENVVLDSVILTIPYFSRPQEINEDGSTTYEIDSIFGSSPIKLSVYRNDYFLRDFNPDEEFNENLTYYIDKSTSDGSIINETDLEGLLLYENEEFLPSNEEIILTTIDPETEESTITQRSSPAIRIHLDNPMEFWESLIFEKEGEPELSNENNFLNHFRGLYIKAEATGPDGTLMMLNMGESSSLRIHYTSDVEDVTDDGGDSENETEQGVFELNFSGNRVNFIEDSFIDIAEGDELNGDEKLFLKGVGGNMAIVNLFSGDEDGNSPELDDFKSRDWLINQAEIEFYVDQASILGQEPDRVFLYDLNTNSALIDYFLDQSVSSTQVNAKIDHLKPLVRVDDDPEGAGIKYKIEITEHINNIFLRDSTNVKLGLVVTANVNTIEPLELQSENGPVNKSVAGTFLSPRGTVLFGNNAPDPDKQVKLKIYYTEPNN